MPQSTTPPRYPRDMTGHGPVPPRAAWPGGARIAVQIVLNYEEGGERCILHGDKSSEAFLSEIPGAQPWPDERHWNMESIYEYGARAGFWRLHRLFTSLGIRPTIYGVATALARAPEQVAAMTDAGWEIASHGLKWIDYRGMPEAEERAQLAEAIRLHREVTGAPPRGFYLGRCSMNTVRLAAETEKFDYISDSYADDLPYWIRVGARDQLVIPYTLDANDMRFSAPEGFATGREFEAYLTDSFDALYREGREGAPKMMSVGLHCRLVGRPGRIEGLRRFLAHAMSHDKVWFPTRAEIADHWAATHPPQEAPRPSELGRDAFVLAYGGVFEHSPWVAERAWDLELGPAHDRAAGLHNALVRAFRSASDNERRDVLRAHPDLAGKLAEARRLTPESAREQAGAGLDALTDEEREAFTELNTRYREKHGIPFIAAVRDFDRETLLTRFRERLENDTAAEIEEACRQVERIALLRLKDLLP